MSVLKLNQYHAQKPEPKQAAFLMTDALECFFGGAAGPGKTSALLMGALQYVDEPHYSAIIFRRSFTDLALPGAVMDRAHEWLADHRKAGDVRWDRERHTFIFPSGATLAFGYVQTPRDKWRYQSAEFQYIGWDELAEFPDDDAYRFMFSRLRRLRDANVPLRVRSASNPVGTGAYWLRKRFIENDPPPMNLQGEIDYSERLFIPATFRDNKHIDQDAYMRSLMELPESTRNALIYGDWEAVEGPAFEEFNEEIHVVDPIAIPYNWRRWEAMDYGVTNPTAWLAAAIAPDETVLVYDEYYKAGELISHHASQILTLRANRWGQPLIALCDPSIQARTGFGSSGRGETVHSEFSRHGIYLVPANNDRRAGRVRIAELLRPDPLRPFPDWHHKAGEKGSPKLFFSRQCSNVIEQVRFAPVDPDEGEVVDPYWETRSGHAMACLRYLLTARIVPNSVSEPEFAGRRMGSWTDWNQWNQDKWAQV